MIDEEIKRISDQKGLTVDKNNTGFSIKKNGHQIAFINNKEMLVKFLKGHNELKSQNDIQSNKDQRSESINPQRDKVLTQTIIQVKEVVITDIQMPFNSMVFFMIKWTIASIPAAILLSILFYLAIALFGGIF
jgi:hypothetical protein